MCFSQLVFFLVLFHVRFALFVRLFAFSAHSFHLKLVLPSRSLFNCSFSFSKFYIFLFFFSVCISFLSSVSTYHSLPFSMRFFFVSCGFCGLFVCFMRQPRKAISRWKIVGGQSVRGVFFFLCRVESTKC